MESEKIYDDSRLNDEGNNVQVQGEINTEGPRQQAETESGDGTLDGYVPYQQVVGDYADDAVNAAKREQLPPAVQSWVEGYFSALQN